MDDFEGVAGTIYSEDCDQPSPVPILEDFFSEMKVTSQHRAWVVHMVSNFEIFLIYGFFNHGKFVEILRRLAKCILCFLNTRLSFG